MTYGLRTAMRSPSLCGRVTARSITTSPPPIREYWYDVDVHGQLFLSETKTKNFTSCYKNPQFLDFFYSRVRRNEPSEENSGAESARGRGYEWVSPCGVEINYLRAEDSVLVFQKLIGKSLTFAGSLLHPFDPSALLVDPHSGYLYHPSPPKPSRRAALPASALTTSPYGPYSLLRSSLVLEGFAGSLEMQGEGEGGGSFLYEGRRWKIGVLREGQVARARGATVRS